MTIRPFQPADATVICDLLIKAIRYSCTGFYTPEELNGWINSRSPELFLGDVANGGRYLIEEQRGRVNGFASWQGSELVSLFVDPQAMFLGVGKRLFNACEENAAKEGSRLTRLFALLNARTYYLPLGFRAVGLHPTLKNGLSLPQFIMTRD
jgi:GNAT superfamily N-acetyltransferase